MDRPDVDSTPDRASPLGRLAVAGVLVLLGSSVFVRSPIGDAGATAVLGGSLLFAGIVLVLATAWRRGAQSTPAATTASSDATTEDVNADSDADSSDDDTAGDDSSVWNAIPPWQYEGRHVESGGLARSEQEAALQDIQDQADELSDDPSQQ